MLNRGREIGYGAIPLDARKVMRKIQNHSMTPDQLRHFDCPSHLRFSKRVEDLKRSRQARDRDLYLATLVFVLESNVHEDWPRLPKDADAWIDFETPAGRKAAIRVRAIGQLRLIREARWLDE